MPNEDDGISLKTPLDHMQNMQRVVTQEIREGDQSLARRIDRLQTNLQPDPSASFAVHCTLVFPSVR